jgi:hypothetical protein
MAPDLRWQLVMKVRALALAPLFGILAACSGGSSGGNGPGVTTEASGAAYTVSYRNKVRLPSSGKEMQANEFAAQLKARDPIAPIRCPGEESPAYQDITQFLGGISWSHPVSIIKDSAYPPLYDEKDLPQMYARAGGAATANDAAPAAAPTIERPDLVGVKNGVGVFLSTLHGLVAIDASGAAPALSCAMKLPGQPKNFLFHGDELVVIVNGSGNANGNQTSALLRYSVAGAKFHFVDAVKLEDQTITDARLFDSTIVAYTDWSDKNGQLGTKVVVVQWDDALGVDWQDSLLNDRQKQDPLEGKDPNHQYKAGELVDEQKTFASFVTASDRYFVVPRSVRKTTFTQYATYSYQVCTNYNPQWSQITECNVNYEQRPNPDYKAPDPVSGNYSCNGKKLEDCITAAAPVVSQYIYVPVGQTCTPVWIGRCETYETRSTTYPQFEYSQATELTIYRFENGTFTKLDSTLAKMTAATDALKFETDPLVLDGSISNRNQLQFQNGHLYFFGDNSLQTMAVAGNSLSYLNKLAIASNTDNNPSIAFASDRAMISSTQYSPQSSVTMLDLTSPSVPTVLTSFGMPGQSTQLMLATGGILGPGTVQLPTGGGTSRSIEKLTLFSRDNGTELDNLLLGTDYDAFATSFFSGSDDQRIRLSDDGLRVFVPYAGRKQNTATEPTAYRLGIARIDTGKLVSERSFAVNDDIIRTAAIDDTHSLVFGNSSSYTIDRTTGDWQLSTLSEFFVPFATYRLNDKDIYVQIARVGTKCRISTMAGDAAVFGTSTLATTDVSCFEGEQPIGFQHDIIFQNTNVGVTISDDGKTIAPLAGDAITTILATVSKNSQRHCWIDGATGGTGQEVDFLDTIPAVVLCEDNQTNAGGAPSAGGGVAGGVAAGSRKF